MNNNEYVFIQKSQLLEIVRDEVQKVHTFYQDRDPLANLEKARDLYAAPGLMTDEQAARLKFGGKVKAETINKLYVNAGLKCYNLKGKRFYDPADIDAFIKDNAEIINGAPAPF